MSWLDVGIDAYRAAQTLKQFRRSCLSRCYYSSYGVATHALSLTKGITFPAGREGPSHAELPNLIENHLKSRLGFQKMKLVKSAVRSLYKGRIDADYLPNKQIAESDVRTALRDAATVIRVLFPEVN